MLVAYSDSDSETPEAPRAKRRKVGIPTSKPRNSNASPPPPPAAFHSLYATNVRGAAADDPTLHGGRTRQVAHVEGNWPTHIYLEWTPSKDELSKLEAVVEDCQAKLDNATSAEGEIHSLLRSSLNVQLPLHISVSAPLTLKTEQKDDFIAAVEAEVCSCGAKSFSVCPKDVAWTSNFDQTRTFLVLTLSQPETDELNKLLHACNASASKYGLNLLYQSQHGNQPANPDKERKNVQDLAQAFHISIAWNLAKMKDLEQMSLESSVLDELKRIVIQFDVVKLKTGNVVTDLKLPQ